MGILNERGLLGDRLLTPEETAAILKYSVGTLAVWRSTGRQGDALPYHKIGGRVRYKESEVRAFLDATKRTHTE